MQTENHALTSPWLFQTSGKLRTGLVYP